MDVEIHTLLTSALAGGKWSASRPGRFTPWGKPTGTYWIGGQLDARADLNDVKKKKFFTLPRLELRPLGRPVRSQSLRTWRPGFLTR
jgi:hypothetical protein